MPADNKVASEDSAGYKLFTELYRKKRVKDGLRDLTKKEFESRVSARWKALTAANHKRYNEEAIQRLTRTPARRKYVSYTACPVSVKRRARSVSSTRRGRKTFRSRSPIRSRHESSRARSYSATSADTDCLDAYTYATNTSYTDTASTYYDEEDCSDATSCSSIASSYDDLTEPAISTKLTKAAAKPKQNPKPRTSKVTKVQKVQKKQVRKKRVTQKATKKAAVPTPAVSKPSTPKETMKKRKQAKMSRARKPRAVTTKHAVPLRRTRASRNVNVKETPPRQMDVEEKLKPASTDEVTNPQVGQNVA